MTRAPRSSKGLGENDATLLAGLGRLLAAEKAITLAVKWRQDEEERFRFERTLDIDGVTEESLIIFGRAVTGLPHRHVTLGLRWAAVTTARGGHFDRLDWRPVGAHNNKGHGPAAWRHVLIEGTHHHPLAENAALPMGLSQAMSHNLPVALPVGPEPDWPEFLAEAARRWRIADLVNIPAPPWQYDLLTYPDGRAGQ
jgi:hypothetical protein